MNVYVLIHDYNEDVQVEVFSSLEKAKKCAENIAREGGMTDIQWGRCGNFPGDTWYIEGGDEGISIRVESHVLDKGFTPYDTSGSRGTPETQA